MKDMPGNSKAGFAPPPQLHDNIVLKKSGPGWNPLYGEWKYRKGGMDTSTCSCSNGFGRNQIKRYIKRVIKQEVRKNMENVNYDYHFKTDTHHDQH